MKRSEKNEATAISWLQGEINYSVEEVIQLIDRLLQEHIEGAKVLNNQLIVGQ